MVLDNVKHKGFHSLAATKDNKRLSTLEESQVKYTYTFYNHFHPFVSELLEKLNQESIEGMLDANFHESLERHFFETKYHPNISVGELYSTTQDGDFNGEFRLRKKHKNWRATWHTIIVGNFMGSGFAQLIFYDASIGEIELHRYVGQGELKPIIEGAVPTRKSWHTIVAGKFSGSGSPHDPETILDLLFYDSQKGEVKFYKIDDEGKLTPLIETALPMAKTWQTIVSGNFLGHNHSEVIFYNARTGEVEIYETGGQGNLRPLNEEAVTTRKTWHSIIALKFPGFQNDALLFYDAQNGEIEFYKIDGQGELVPLINGTVTTRKTWHSIVAGDWQFGSKHSELFFYDAQNGEAEISHIRDNGTLLVKNTYTGLSTTWHTVVAPKWHSGDDRPGLLFYDSSPNIKFFPKEIDTSEHGAYAVYNWELMFHVPLTIAVHLSKNQRFAEAQRWFHYIFNPTANDGKFWRFIAFRQDKDIKQIDELLRLFSKPDDECTEEELAQKNLIESGYNNFLKDPFQPHVVARTRFLANQYCVLMKYLDNLIAWGDSLFRQDTIETINEAMQVYVLAASLLGEKPQRIPARGTTRPTTFAQIKDNGLDPLLGNALVELEGAFPFNLYFPATKGVDTDRTNSLFGIGRTLYFCIPRNDKLLGYWDTVADRLFKIRHCMNIEGVVRQLPLFQPPIDPGVLVKAAAAGIDISSLVSGLNQPLAPVRSALLIQKALEICSEVRSLGAALLSALEKQDAEKMGRMRQEHEINIQQLAQDARFLQWKEAESATESLRSSRDSAVERYRFYQRLMGNKESEELEKLLDLDLERPKDLTESNFDEIYDKLVGKYAQDIVGENYPDLKVIDEGKLFLNLNEDAELNTHLPAGRDAGKVASIYEAVASSVAFTPDGKLDLHYWGLGGTVDIPLGRGIKTLFEIAARVEKINSTWERDQAGLASRTATYERRADDWRFQSNLAARELMQIGRQIISSLIREQITFHEYENLKEQIKQSQDIDQFLRDKFTNEELFGWMQGELCKIYYECYKFAFDIARQAEQTMKHELMRPELDAMDFIKFNYWDGGRKGLLSGESLYLDLKRLEMAYHDHNKREYELTKHVSLHQLDPVALLSLKATGACEIVLPEWLFDLDTPGHYMRRIKNVSLSIPAVTGPYTSVNCTLSLLKSRVRRSALLRDGGEYEPAQDGEDTRFVDYYGTIQSIVTSNSQNDSGMFETNLRDERFLPFEGHGAVSTWKLELPAEFRQFDYNTISDVILHIRYTARQGGDQLKKGAVAHLRSLLNATQKSGLIQLFSLRHDFPNEWHKFVTGEGDFEATIKKEDFPYFGQNETITAKQWELCTFGDNGLPLEHTIVSEIGEHSFLKTDSKNKKIEIHRNKIFKEDEENININILQVSLLVKYIIE